MAIMALAYSNTNLLDENTPYDPESTDVAQMSFETLQFFPPELNNTVVSGTMLNGRKYTNKKYTHKSWQVVISTSELSDDALTFLKAFFKAHYKYIVDDLVAGNYNEVIQPDEKFSPAYIDGIVLLPEITFNFIAAIKEAS